MVVGQALTPSTFLTTVDRARLKAVFEAALPVTDVVNAHYSILGLKMLGAPIPNAQVQSVLKHCVFSPNEQVQSVLNYIDFISKWGEGGNVSEWSNISTHILLFQECF